MTCPLDDDRFAAFDMVVRRRGRSGAAAVHLVSRAQLARRTLRAFISDRIQHF
jgi:hypothetical protein